MTISVFGEFRALEKKTSTKGDYVVVSGEDREGIPFHIYSRNVAIANNLKKSDDCEFVADLTVGSKFTNLELKQITVL